ncbi:MAG TPA: LysR family transcriptional regulator [Acidobacteriaceae bacterium]|nr:LysR family transcriptional regulator [Acidobacteriaceae bacterium]
MNTTIDQWEVFQTVVQLGSFAAAAKKTNRSQSTISYAISRLQEQFKVPLFEMKGRKAQLTEAGKALLADAEPVLNGFRALEAKAASLASNEEREIKVSVDSLYPDDRLFRALAHLNRTYPLVRPTVEKKPFLSSAYELETAGADLCITGLPAREHFAKAVLDIRIMAVARADHPLLRQNRELARLDLTQHLAVIIEGANLPEPKRQPHAKTQRILVVHSVESAIEAVRSGMCFGWLPVYRIAPWLNAGELSGLRLPLYGERVVRMFLVLKDAESIPREKLLLADLLGANTDAEAI